MLEFGNLIVNNFVTYKNLEINLRNKGIVFIKGENGHGKSLICDMITWCLFGDTVREILANEIIGKFNNKTEVSLEIFEDDKLYVVKRIREKDKVILTINNKAKSAINETQKQVDSLLGCNFLLFRNTVIFGQNDKKIFSFLNDHEKKELFEYIYPELEKFKIGIKKINELNYKLLYEKDNIISKLDVYNETLYKEKEKLLDIKKDSRKEYKNKIKDFKKEFKKLNYDLTEVIKAIDAFNKNLKNYNIKKSEIKIENLKNKINYLSIECGVLDKDINTKYEKLNKLKNSDNKTICEYCGNKITIEKINKYKNEIKNNISEQNKRKDSILDVIKFLNKKFNFVKKDIDDYNKLIGCKKNCLDDKKYIEENIINLKNNKPILDKSNLFTKKQRKHIKNLEKNIKRLLINKNLINEKIRRNDFFKFAFSDKGIKSKIIATIAPRLTDYANKYSNILTNGKQQVVFSNLTELKSKTVDKINIIVNDEDGKKDLRVLSGGQKKTANLSIILAFGDLLNSRIKKCINFRFYDEPFDNLDLRHKNNVIDLIESFGKEYGTILIISHDKTMEDSFDNIINVKKEKGESKIYEMS